jgi:hypothetical protein
MENLGIYIFNSTRGKWYCGGRVVAKWGSFEDAKEFSPSDEDYAEEIREEVSGDDVTFTMAARH